MGHDNKGILNALDIHLNAMLSCDTVYVFG